MGMLQRTAGSACFSLPMSRLYPRGESATLRADFSEEGIQMKKQLWGLFCAAVLAATLALPVRAAEQTHRAYLCGYPDGTIRPNARITRAQLACALVRLAEEPLPEPTRVTFFDVPGDHWACTQIRQLAGLGLLPFGEGGWFLPSATVSWRELCSVLDTLAERIVAVSIVYLICLIQLAKGFVGVSCND